MSEPQVQFITVGNGPAKRAIAYLQQDAVSAQADALPSALTTAEAVKPGIIWLPGFRSEMASIKACALATWTAQQGLALTRFDYSGHGRSQGQFIEACIGDWLDECEAVFTQLTSRPKILVGSSMGGWLALLLARRLQETAPKQAVRIKAMVLLAPAWDMTQTLMWDQASATARDEICTKGVYMRPSAYGDEPYPITLKLIEEGRNHLLADRPFDPGVPIHILHGVLDSDVPLPHSKALQDLLPGHHVVIEEVGDGEHRLSRPQDLERLLAMIAALL